MNYELIKTHVSSRMDNNDSCWNLDKDGKFSVEGIEFELMPWRYERKLCSLHHLAVENEAVGGLCSYKATVVESKNSDVYELLYRELDVCQWILNDKIVSIYALENSGKTISVVAKTEKKILCAIDIATTLCAESTPVTRHEIVGQEGMISDRCVDERIPTKAMYVFEQDKINPISCTDLDLFVEGLNPEEVYVLEYMTDVISKNEIRSEMVKAQQQLLKNIDCVNKSLKTGDVSVVEVTIRNR